MIKTVTVRICDIPNCRRELKDGETLHFIQFQGVQADVCADCSKHFAWLEKELREFVYGHNCGVITGLEIVKHDEPHSVRQVHVHTQSVITPELDKMLRRQCEESRLGSWCNQ